MTWTLVGAPDPITLDDLDFLEHVEWENDQWFPIRDNVRGVIIAFLRLKHPMPFSSWIDLAKRLADMLVTMGYASDCAGIEILGRRIYEAPTSHISMDTHAMPEAEAESLAFMCQLQVFVV